VTANVDQPILRENDRVAGALRDQFLRSGTLCLNLISSPGAGKTALLERTLATIEPGIRTAVVTGDIQTDNDARRLIKYGFPVRQISTAGICHLDAVMIARTLSDWDLDALDLLLIENVGNLVCPTSYDLGEHAKIVLLSVTEGDDKPQKYPGIFRRAELALITKIDLLPHVQFSVSLAIENAKALQPAIQYRCLSTLTGQGFESWMQWLTSRLDAVKPTSRSESYVAQNLGATPCGQLRSR
jgi:hydrogenase nickel incorporation protein HypB